MNALQPTEHIMKQFSPKGWIARAGTQDHSNLMWYSFQRNIWKWQCPEVCSINFPLVRDHYLPSSRGLLTALNDCMHYFLTFSVFVQNESSTDPPSEHKEEELKDYPRCVWFNIRRSPLIWNIHVLLEVIKQINSKYMWFVQLIPICLFPCKLCFLIHEKALTSMEYEIKNILVRSVHADATTLKPGTYKRKLSQQEMKSNFKLYITELPEEYYTQRSNTLESSVCPD